MAKDLSRRYRDSPYIKITDIPYDIAQLRQPLSLALSVSPIALLTSPFNGYLNHIALLELFQVYRSLFFVANLYLKLRYCRFLYH